MLRCGARVICLVVTSDQKLPEYDFAEHCHSRMVCGGRAGKKGMEGNQERMSAPGTATKTSCRCVQSGVDSHRVMEEIGLQE
eukprot:3937690-Rhodomonas_salina.2